MKRWRTGGRKILIIIVVDIIVCILAILAIPLYIGYVERERVTEATSNMGAIITSQKVEKQRTGKYYSGSTIAEFHAKGIDISDTKFFTYETVATLKGGFIVTATSTDALGAGGVPITFTYDPTKTPPGRWGDEDPILKDWLLIQI
ncbi:MAG: type IV pilin protein [Candidatus Hodarchaeota archaeon]